MPDRSGLPDLTSTLQDRFGNGEPYLTISELRALSLGVAQVQTNWPAAEDSTEGLALAALQLRGAAQVTPPPDTLAYMTRMILASLARTGPAPDFDVQPDEVRVH